MPTLIRGDRLTPELREQVLRAFVHRWTIENQHNVSPRNRPKDPPLWNDEDWLREHAFYITSSGSGRLALKPRHCEPAYMAEARP
jgi:hypothetical protein